VNRIGHLRSLVGLVVLSTIIVVVQIGLGIFEDIWECFVSSDYKVAARAKKAANFTCGVVMVNSKITCDKTTSAANYLWLLTKGANAVLLIEHGVICVLGYAIQFFETSILDFVRVALIPFAHIVSLILAGHFVPPGPIVWANASGEVLSLQNKTGRRSIPDCVREGPKILSPFVTDRVGATKLIPAFVQRVFVAQPSVLCPTVIL
jgi:hypothetical protein